MEFENLLIEIEDGIGLVTINRPQALNALNRETLAELATAIDELSDEDEVQVIILTGSGEKAFVAGADIRELAENSPLESNVHAMFGQSLMDLIEELGMPTIAAVNGYALGGGLELAMACSIRIASTNAKLGLPEVGLGIIPGFGGTQRLPRLVGQGRAMHMVLTAEPVDAATALQYGLVTEVHEPAELLGAAKVLAKKLMAKSSLTLRIAEETVRVGAEMAQTQGMAYEASQFGLAASAEDYQEGMQAFLEKRKPEFQGR
jgi:enoyl-CoA hydratase